MKTTGLRYAVGVGLGGMLALAAGAGFAQARTETGAAIQVAQYCILPPDNPDAHRFYCEHADSWSGHAGTTRVELLRARTITMSVTGRMQ
jgi:hypothetical protein